MDTMAGTGTILYGRMCAIYGACILVRELPSDPGMCSRTLTAGQKPPRSSRIRRVTRALPPSVVLQIDGRHN